MADRTAGFTVMVNGWLSFVENLSAKTRSRSVRARQRSNSPIAMDVRFETDFRSVYARVLDNWMGSDSSAILGGDFRNGPNFI